MPEILVLVFSALFIIVFIGQIAFSVFNNFNFSKIPKKYKSENEYRPQVSVIIAARNEEQNLRLFLPKVLNQKYDDFEVILVNDASTDSSKLVAEAFTKDYRNLIIINLAESNGKKNALKKGILKAKSEYLLFIDADCYPVSENWISSMVNAINEKDIVLGYGGFKYENTFTSKFVNYDTFQIAIQYFSAARFGKPYMGVGRNLLYKKSVWEKVGGFESHNEILSGDDDLFISEVANANNTSTCITNESQTMSVPVKTIKELVRQKSRHISTAHRYSIFASIFTTFDIVSRSLFYLIAILLLLGGQWIFALSLIILRILLLYLIAWDRRKTLNSKISFHYFILFDIFAPIFYFAVVISNRFIIKAKTW